MTLPMTGSTLMLRRVLRLAIVPAFAAMVMGGCNNKKGLEAEAQELRDKLEQTETALRDCETERSRILAENDKFRGGGGGGVTGDFGGADVSTRGTDVVVSVAGDVLFDSGSVTLKQSARQTLDRIAGTIQSQYGGHQLRIAGHTDSDPIRRSSWKTNERLSAERALTVEDYLSQRGLSKDRMYIAGYGPAMPKGDKKSSRRVEIIIISAGGS